MCTACSDHDRSLFQAMYHGSAPRPMTRSDLNDIRHTAVRHNAAAGVTGVLLYGWQQFVQVLEGPGGELLSLLGCIARDDRIQTMQIDAIEPIQSAAFPDWTMLVVNLEAAGSDARFRYAAIMESIRTTITPGARVASVQMHLAEMQAYLVA
ncbi:MAG: BLUF domain-containing protein [Planctomycetota bacterium]